MFVHAQEKPETKYYEVYDADIGQRINFCLWANDETGEYCVLKLQNGVPYIDSMTRKLVKEIKKGNIKIVEPRESNFLIRRKKNALQGQR